MPIAPSHSELRRTSSRSGEVEDPADLLDVGRGVRVDLFLGEPRPGRRLARRVADHGGEVADDQHGDVAEILEQAELAQHDREAEVDVGGGRVDPELDPQRAAAPELARAARPRR